MPGTDCVPLLAVGRAVDARLAVAGRGVCGLALAVDRADDGSCRRNDRPTELLLTACNFSSFLGIDNFAARSCAGSRRPPQMIGNEPNATMGMVHGSAHAKALALGYNQGSCSCTLSTGSRVSRDTWRVLPPLLYALGPRVHTYIAQLRRDQRCDAMRTRSERSRASLPRGSRKVSTALRCRDGKTITAA